MNIIVRETVGQTLPSIVATAGERAGWRFMEFFTAAIRNPNTRRAYARDVRGFLAWCTEAGIASIVHVSTMHVGAYIEQLGKAHPAPTVKRHLAAIRHMFDYLATGGILPFNPAAAVRGPRHSVKRGKTPVLAGDEARQLLDAIDTSTLSGMRDRALIALMVYSFARIGAATGMRVEDVFTDQRRLWVRLNEKGGKRHEMPCHHNLEAYLHAWLDGSGLSTEPKAPLFPTIAAGSGRGEQRLTRRAISPREAHAMVRKRAKQAGSPALSAIIRFAAPASPPTSRTAARWRRRARWPIMPTRAPRASMTAAPRTLASTTWSGFRSDIAAVV